MRVLLFIGAAIALGVLAVVWFHYPHQPICNGSPGEIAEILNCTE